MDIDIRPIGRQQWEAFQRTTAAAFGFAPDPDESSFAAEHYEFDRSLAAFDGDRIVGTGGAYSLELTLPGLTNVPAGGLTWIGVLPSHRRRGILRGLVERHFDDVEAHGEPLSLLYASESVIYGRFGYGSATQLAWYRIDPRHGAFSTRVRLPAGQVRMVDGDEAWALLPELHERFRRTQPGELRRPTWYWRRALDDPAWASRRDRGPRFNAVYEAEPGQVEGAVAWRCDERWSQGLADSRITVLDLYALTPQATAALWRFVLDLDLAAEVRLGARPLDEPLRWLLADPRRLRTSHVADGLWARLLDLPAALAARRYATAGTLVLEVGDALRPRNQGRFRLDGGPDRAACAPTRAEPDLVVDVSDLGAAYLGGTRLASLARAGRVLEARPGALRRADAMFAADPPPWATIDF